MLDLVGYFIDDPDCPLETIRNNVNNSIRGGGQARDIIFDVRVSGMNSAEARAGIARSWGITRGKIDSIRVIGNGFFFTTFAEDYDY